MKAFCTLNFILILLIPSIWAVDPPATGIIYNSSKDFAGYGGRSSAVSGPVIDFNFGSGSVGNDPFTTNPLFNNYSIRWNGVVLGRTSETYTLRTISDDGVRLYFDGQLVIDDWNGNEGRRQNTAQVQVTQGEQHLVTLEYQECEDVAEAHLYWSSQTVPTELIPFVSREGQENFPIIDSVTRGVTPFTAGARQIFDDGDDVVNSSANIIDIAEIRVNAYEKSFGFTYILDFIPEEDIADPSNGYNLFIDTDLNGSSGYQVFSIGAEFLIQGRQLLRYTGNGTDWSWEFVAYTYFEKGRFLVDPRTIITQAVRREWLGNSSSFRMVFFGDNAAERGGNTTDVVPDDAGQGGFLEFSEGDPSGITFDGKLDDYAAYASNFPRDPADQPNSSAVDFRQLLVGNSTNQYNLGYWNQRTIDLGDDYLMFVDTNRNLDTGYVVFGRRADYMIRGERVFRYTGGTSGVWSWEFIGNAETVISGNTAELRFPRAWFGNQTDGTRIEFKFYGLNQGAGADTYPDGSDWLEYRLQ